MVIDPRSGVSFPPFLLELNYLIKELARQERLLQGLMSEIIRMTAQKQPLEVGVPSYRFSHRTVFRKEEVAATAPEGSTTASLPRNTRYRGRIDISPGQPNAIPPDGESSRNTGWASFNSGRSS